MQRQIDLDGCLNFRDLGGYPTGSGRTLRWRLLFRSDSLHRLSEADTRVLIDELRLSDVVDLRSSAELESEGRGLLAGASAAFHHTPLFDGDRTAREQAPPMSLSERYFGLLKVAEKPIAHVMEIIAVAEGSVVYHCAAGKDRTGVISCLLMSALGVPDEVIAADYALTQQNLDAIIDRLMSLDGYRSMLSALPPDTLHAEPETMIETLSLLRGHYGSVAGYLASAGCRGDLVARLRARLLE